MTPAATVPDPAGLLRAAYGTWATSPVWTLWALTTAGERVVGGVRPGMQWIEAGHLDAAVLVEGAVARVRGTLLLQGLLGPVEPARVEAAVRGRWVTCPAEAWLRRGADHSALGWFGKGLDGSDDVRLVTADDTGGTLVARLLTRRGTVTVQRTRDGTTRLVQCLDRSGFVRWTWDDVPLVVPRPAPDEVVALDEVLRALGPAPEPPAPGPAHESAGEQPHEQAREPVRQPGRATVEVFAPDEPGEQWSLYSDDLAAVLGVEAGHEAQTLALRALAVHVPHLVHLVEGDSYDTVFSAYVPDERTAREVAEVLRRLPAGQ
ncbi:hypothetical protein [Kineosporia sp. R_H_3]|uniref:hypothetical protein n=1 Tax=Kineosporia sp. R_H_3 TaxID=1961848 RepID=UPI000B4A881C|nr:hypothetical protein [Kineosporia sp. R_H_3]